MQNRGCVIACDKSLPKIKQIAENARLHGLTIVHPFLQDGVKVGRGPLEGITRRLVVS
jgi:hypothetical protein